MMKIASRQTPPDILEPQNPSIGELNVVQNRLSNCERVGQDGISDEKVPQAQPLTPFKMGK